MKKSLVFLLVVVLGIFLLTGCLTKEKVDENGNDGSQATVFSLAAVKAEIKENYINGTEGWNKADPDVVPLKTIENVIVVYDASDYGYIYGVTSDGTGLYFKVDSSLDISLKDTFEATGRPYYVERDAESAIFEYRFSVAQSDSEVDITANDQEIPWDKADTLTIDNLPSMDNLGNLVTFTGTYLGTDDHDHYDFDLNGDGNSDVKIVKYSNLTLTENKIYKVKGVMGYSYGFKVYVGDPSFVTEK